MQLKELVPPALAAVARRRRLGGGRSFQSYEEAATACGTGYEHDTTIRVVLAKTKHFRDTTLAARPLKADVIALRNFFAIAAASTNNRLDVLDFGGACGLHYFYARALLGTRVELRWHVVETPKMVAAARELEDGSLKFSESIESTMAELGEPDLIFSSSVLQCLPKPYETLKQLVACNARHLFLTRAGLAIGPRELYTVQTATFSGTGPGPLPPTMQEGIVKYPLTFPRKVEIEQILNERYDIEVEIVEEERAHVAGNEWINMYGFFTRRKSP